MLKKTHILLVIFLVLFACNKTSQIRNYEPDLKKIKEETQKKLDTGISMLETSRNYNNQTDSILELIVNDYSNLIDEKKKENFKLEQNEWLKKKENLKDSLWNEIDIIFKETGFTPELEHMVAYGEIGDLNYNRAIELNKRIRKIKN
jgi:hypothetical protein